MGLLEMIGLHRVPSNEDLVKSIAVEVDRIATSRQAAEQRAMINDRLIVERVYDTTMDVREKPDVSFMNLGMIANDAEPVIAIIERRCQQVAPYAQLPDVRHGYVRRPGIQARMTNPKTPATPEDERNMAELEHFFLEGGFTEPPRDERPTNWQPGFEPFLRQLTRDSLTYDWAIVRRWKSDDNPKKFPITAFCADDASRIRHTRRPIIGLENGVLKTEDYPGVHPKSYGEIKFVKQMGKERGSMVIGEFREDQMCAWIRNPRTDEDANGYGLSELERGINAANAWCMARDYNTSRFRNDSLPRGLLAVMGQLDMQQFAMFKMEWNELLQGLGKRWKIPIIRGLPGQGSSVNWVPFDMSSRDMEYNEFLNSISVWVHAIFSIHPDETGFDAISPYRPPLSEASPETKLEYSQDVGLSPILRSLQNLLNREIVWRMYPDRRYTLWFVGVGQFDQMQDAEMRASMLEAGLTTPRMQWNELDLVIPEIIKDSPAWDLPGPFMTNVQMLMAVQQQQEAAQAQQMQMMQAQAQQGAMAQQQAVAGGGQQGQPQQPGTLPPSGADQSQQGMGGTPAQMVPGEGTPIRPAPEQAYSKAVTTELYPHITGKKYIVLTGGRKFVN